MRSYLTMKRDTLLSSGGLFWLPSGYNADDVLAAYQFKGVASEAVALTDLSGHGYDLLKASESYQGVSHSPSWNSSNGFTFDAVMYGACGYLDNSTLNGQQIRTVVVRYSDLTQDNRGYLVTAGGDNGRCQVACATTLQSGDTVTNYGGAGFVWYDGHWRSTSTFRASAIVGANVGTSNQVYINGEPKNTTDREARTDKGSGVSWRTFGNVHAPLSNLSNAVHAGKKIQAAVFFRTVLTAEQHAEVAQRMAEL